MYLERAWSGVRGLLVSINGVLWSTSYPHASYKLRKLRFEFQPTSLQFFFTACAVNFKAVYRLRKLRNGKRKQGIATNSALV